jgi:hypothetical protein
MNLTAFGCNRSGFLPELFTVSSHRFYHDPSTGKASITLHAPHRSVVVAFIGLVIQKGRMIWVPIRGACEQQCNAPAFHVQTSTEPTPQTVKRSDSQECLTF